MCSSDGTFPLTQESIPVMNLSPTLVLLVATIMVGTLHLIARLTADPLVIRSER